MSRGMPSMTALLGLLAIAGYQNRDKLAELLKGAGGGSTGSQQSGGLLGNRSGRSRTARTADRAFARGVACETVSRVAHCR